HAILIPAICIWILYLEREKIFAIATRSLDFPSAALFFVPACLVAAGDYPFGLRLSEVNQLFVVILPLVLFWIARCALVVGSNTLRRASFPRTFLLLTIPIPDFLLDKTIYFLQKGTTEIAAVLFDWSGVPVLRDGFVFHLARVNIEVARECSGIR